VTPYLRRTDYGLTQLGTWGLHKGKLLNPFLALPLSILLLLVSVGHHIGQTLGFCLSRIASLACFRQLALHKGNPPSEPLGLPMGRG
jgi:hypothetical protein